jgi:hypothetical protein
MSPPVQCEDVSTLFQPARRAMPFVSTPGQTMQQEYGWAIAAKIDATHAGAIDIQKHTFAGRHSYALSAIQPL